MPRSGQQVHVADLHRQHPRRSNPRKRELGHPVRPQLRRRDRVGHGPDGTRPATITLGIKPFLISIAPAGTPRAGTAYVANSGGKTVSVISPDGTKVATMTVGLHPCSAAIAPGGAPNAGTVYVTNTGEPTASVIRTDGTVSIIRPRWH